MFDHDIWSDFEILISNIFKIKKLGQAYFWGFPTDNFKKEKKNYKQNARPKTQLLKLDIYKFQLLNRPELNIHKYKVTTEGLKVSKRPNLAVEQAPMALLK